MELDELISACKKNQRLAQKELVGRIAPGLKGLCQRYLNTDFEVEEALQESLIKILRSIASYELERDSFFAWIKRITVNTIFTRLRSQMRGPEVIGIDASPPAEVAPEVYDRLYKEELMDLIHSLPLGYRSVLCLYAIDGYSHKEIADLLNISEGTSRSQLTRARYLLKQKINSSKKGFGWKQMV